MFGDRVIIKTGVELLICLSLYVANSDDIKRYIGHFLREQTLFSAVVSPAEKIPSAISSCETISMTSVLFNPNFQVIMLASHVCSQHHALFAI